MDAVFPCVMTTSGFEYIDHPADVWIHAFGPSFEHAMEQCVYGLMDTMLDPSQIRARETFSIDIEEQTRGSLLIAFLSEFLFLFDTEGIIIHSIHCNPVETTSTGSLKLHAVAQGEYFDPAVHEPDTEVKAITYSYLEILEKNDRTEIKIVYDI